MSGVRLVLLKAVPTGRKTKEDERRSSTIVAGVKVAIIENDMWEGGVPDEGVRQQYHRCTWLELPEPDWRHQ